MFTSKVHYKDSFVGKVNVYLERNCEVPHHKLQPIKIFNYQYSGRCSPLDLLQAVSPRGAILKLKACEAELETSGQVESHLPSMHRSMMSRNMTAVIKLDNDEEIHLVAMTCLDPRQTRPVFWGFNVRKGHHGSCRSMIGDRRLSLVLHLDDTLLVFNTVESFTKKIKDLKEKIDTEADTDLVFDMIQERRRYAADLALLQQYINEHQVIFNGKRIHAVSEDIIELSPDRPATRLPVIRLKDSNIVLTRLMPHRPESSVLVRTRPGWDTLFKYLTHRPDKKHFSIYISSTAPEAEVPLELWRVLDPQYKLIQPAHLLTRIVTTPPGVSKSLPGVCLRMLLAIDNTADSWIEDHKGRVHVIPAFKGYDKPFQIQLLDNELRSARAVAENIWHRFYKKFNQVFVPKLAVVRYEDVVQEVVPPVDVKLLLDELKRGERAAGKSGVRNESSAGTSGVRNESMFSDQIASRWTPRDMNGLQQDIMQYLARDHTSSQSTPRVNSRSRDPRCQHFRPMNFHTGNRSSSQDIQEVEPLLIPSLESPARQPETVPERSGGETPWPAAQTNVQTEIQSTEAAMEQTENAQEVEPLLIHNMESLAIQPESVPEISGGETPRPAAQTRCKEAAGTSGMRNEPIFGDQLASISAPGDGLQQDTMQHLARDDNPSQTTAQLNSTSRDPRLSHFRLNFQFGDGYSSKNAKEVEPLLISSTKSPTRPAASIPERSSGETPRPAAQETEIQSTAAVEQTDSVSVLAEICLKKKLDLVYKLQQQPQSTIMNHNSEAEGSKINLQIRIDGEVIASGSGPTWTSAAAPAADLALERLRERLLVSSRERQGPEAVPADIILRDVNEVGSAHRQEQTSAADPQAADGVLEGLPQHHPSPSRTRSRRRRRSESTPPAPQDSPGRRVSGRVRKQPKKFEDCIALDSSYGQHFFHQLLSDN